VEGFNSGVKGLNANRDYSADLWTIINEPGGEIASIVLKQTHPIHEGK
jgi:hypothetical protein